MNYIIIILLSFSISSFAQQQKFVVEKDSVRFKNCDEGISEAKADFINGNYYSYSYGFTVTIDEDFDKFFDQYMEEKYKIYFKIGGCVVTPYTKCYKKTMNDLIKHKFGEDIFERSRIEAKKLYTK